MYGLWLEQLREQYLADRTAFGVWALTSHAKDAVPPSWDERQAEFDQRLADDGRTPSVLERFGIRLAA